jgi:hypothetical protein
MPKSIDIAHTIIEYRKALRLARGVEIEQHSRCDYARGWFYINVATRFKDKSIGFGGVLASAYRSGQVIELTERLNGQAARRFTQATTLNKAIAIYRDAVLACYGPEVLDRSTFKVSGNRVNVLIAAHSAAPASTHTRRELLNMARSLYERSWAGFTP